MHVCIMHAQMHSYSFAGISQHGLVIYIAALVVAHIQPAATRLILLMHKCSPKNERALNNGWTMSAQDEVPAELKDVNKQAS
jgi:hypothetical protein